MTNDEAREVAKILVTADNGCSTCARELFALFLRKYPDFTDVCVEVFNREFEDYDLLEELKDD